MAFLSPFLYIRIVPDFFHSLDIFWTCSILLNTFLISFIRISPPYFMYSFFMLSSSEVFCFFFKLFIIDSIFLSVNYGISSLTSSFYVHLILYLCKAIKFSRYFVNFHSIVNFSSLSFFQYVVQFFLLTFVSSFLYFLIAEFTALIICW